MSINKTLNTHSNWLYIYPVSGLSLSSVINNELLIGEVTIVSIKKLTSCRKRFGISKTINELKQTDHALKTFFSTFSIFAIVRNNGKPIEDSNKILKKINDALEILSSSQLGYSKRRSNSFPRVYFSNVTKVFNVCFDTNNETWVTNGRITSKYQNLELNDNWLKYQKHFYFIDLLKIINQQIILKPKWRSCLRRAAILIGRSQNSTNLSTAFLFNMIAIEVLLTRRSDKYSEAIPERIEVFLGWIGFWEVDDYPNRIVELYKKRCQFVHDGDDTNITVEDLLFSDDLILNLFNNIISNIKLFSSKDVIIEFSEKIKAEKILGLDTKRSKIRPKKLYFSRRKYTNEDLQEI